jgi:cytochrome c biogenesis protein CcmG, thiol:disulfide interchange protein DsbE
MENETPPKKPRRRVPTAVALPLVAVAAVAAAFLATRPLGGQPRPSFFVIDSAAPGVRVGQIAPGTVEAPASSELALTDLGGAPITLRDFAGHPLWVIFWKTACEPCEVEAPDVAAAYAAHRSDGLVVLGIDVWDTAAAVRDYAEEHDLAYPIAIDSATTFKTAYGVWGAPTHYFIGSDGIIRDRYFGPMTATMMAESLGRVVPTSAP